MERGRLVLADCVGCIVVGGEAAEVRRLAVLEVGRGAPAATVLGHGLSALRPTQWPMSMARRAHGTT